MKKYLSFLFAFSLIFVFGLSLVSNKAQATINTCTKESVFNEDGTPCALMPSCPIGADVDFRTGLACPGVNQGSADAKHDYYTDYLAATLKTAPRGEKSVDAAYLQAFLVENKLLEEKYVTTYYGPRTAGALRIFQRNAGLKSIDGTMGPKTLDAMRATILRSSSARAIATRAKSYYRTPASTTKPSFTEVTQKMQALDLTKEAAWGTPVKFERESGKAIIYVKDFGLDAKNGQLNTMVTFVDIAHQ